MSPSYSFRVGFAQWFGIGGMTKTEAANMISSWQLNKRTLFVSVIPFLRQFSQIYGKGLAPNKPPSLPRYSSPIPVMVVLLLMPPLYIFDGERAFG